ncbi:MAG TPA: CNNM domain-containing protein, partial [Pyrinomonadaceae bacterium]
MDELPSSWLGLLIAEGDVGASTTWTMTFLKLLAVMILVAANGFFVAAEFALVGVRSSRIETLAAAGSRSAKRL